MSDFFRFPHTPHLAWLGEGTPRDDKVLSPREAEGILKGEVVVEEKIDGANIGFSVARDGEIRVQNRGQYLDRPFHGQFSRLGSWLMAYREDLVAALGENLILFGEWSAARHSLAYNRLPDWFLAFDVHDRETQGFWSTRRRDLLVTRIGLSTVPRIFSGHTTLSDLKRTVEVGVTACGDGPIEGIVVRKEDGDWLRDRSKLVRPDFTQTISDHWTRRKIEWNKVIPTASPVSAPIPTGPLSPFTAPQGESK